MSFYAHNLSMVGTHAALLAGFAFTILSQYEFKVPMEGYLPYDAEVWLGLWANNRVLYEFPDFTEEQVMSFRKGIGSWTWNTWLQQIFQVLHLLFTSLGMTLTLWTLYTCVITNILGVHLALRGPEGSVDKAVRHMAQQNQFALRKFMWGLVLFLLSVIFFSLSEYHFFVSLLIVISVLIMTRQIYLHIHLLVASFHLESDDTVTGQWDLTSQGGTSSRQGSVGGLPPAAGAAGEYGSGKSSACPGVFGMGDMLATKYAECCSRRGYGLPCLPSLPLAPCSADSAHPRLIHRYSSFRKGKAGEQKSAFAVRWDALRERLRQGKRRGGSAWASLNGWAGGGSLIQEDPSSLNKEVQNPTFIAEQLIFRQQKTPAEPGRTPPGLSRRLTRSGSRRRLIRASGAFASTRASSHSERLEPSLSFPSGRGEASWPSRCSCGRGVADPSTRASVDETSSMRSPPSAAAENGEISLLPNVLGLTPFLDDLISKMGHRGCIDQAHSWNRASRHHRRSTASSAVEGEGGGAELSSHAPRPTRSAPAAAYGLHFSPARRSIEEESRMTEYSDSSLREDESAGGGVGGGLSAAAGAAPSALRPCASRGDSLNANIFDQAGDVIEQVRGH